MAKKEINKTIVSAYQNSKYRWRTAQGIAKETTIPNDTVFEFLRKSDLVIKAKKTNKNGQLLFALKEKYDTESPLKVKILNALTNKIH
jgi:hypothetical protein|tara:strand:+ start:925 stop:1188 length:264 start_codon:yes stop_codon:yes gene_type:complete